MPGPVVPNQALLNGINPLAYMGVRPTSPTLFLVETRDPLTTDKNYALGTWWMNNNSPYNLWRLANLNAGTALWIMVNAGAGAIISLTSNSGGPVFPLAGNINVVGDGVTITGVGNPGTNTITFSLIGGQAAVDSLTGNSGGAVFPAANGNINVLGTGIITVVGNPGTNTLTITPSGAIASSFPTDSGTATPAVGVLNILAQRSTLGAGSSVLFSAPGPSNTVQFNITDASSNTIVGNNAGNLTLSGSNNTALGKTTVHALTTGNANSVIGSLSGALITSGSNNTVIGEGSATSLLTGSSNIIIGQAAGNNLTGAEGTNLLIGFGGLTGTSGLVSIGIPGDTIPYVHNWGGGNSFFGRSGNLTLTPGTATNNAGLGNTALGALTTGNQNTGVGNSALQSATTGSTNTAVGAGSLQLLTTGSQNTAVGDGALSKITTSIQNTAIGLQSLFNITTGANNTAIGLSAGNNYTGAESNNICLGSLGVLGESAVMRLGLTGTTAKAFIVGVFGVTTDVNDAVPVLIDSAGQLGQTSSTIRVKENVVDMADYSNDILELRPVVFNYKQYSPESKSVGLIAEEVDLIMPKLVVKDSEGLAVTVKYQDLIPMLLNELIKLNKRVLELEQKRP